MQRKRSQGGALAAFRIAKNKINEAHMDLRSLQKPLKEKYRANPTASRITLRAKGSQTDAPITKPKPTKASEARAQAPAPAIFCLALWPRARKSPARW